MSEIKQSEALVDAQKLTDAELARVTGGAPTTTATTTTTTSGGGGGTGKVVVQDMHFTKKVD